MSKNETPLTKRYWKEIGGTLIEEFPAVRRGSGSWNRQLDGVVVFNGSRRLIKREYGLEVDGKRIRRSKGKISRKVQVKGKRIIVIQTKPKPISMSLLGQALFSRHLMEEFEPKRIYSVAICTKGDVVLEKLAKEYKIKVVVYKP